MVGARATGFLAMLEKFVHTVSTCQGHKTSSDIIFQLPDMDFPINAKAEGRVVVPWEHRQFPNLTRQDSSGEPRPHSTLYPSFNVSHKPESKPCSTGPSAQTGPVEAMSGKHGGAPARPMPLPDGSSPPYAVLYRPKLPTTFPLLSRGPVLTLPLCLQPPPPPSTSARVRTNTTTRAIFSQTGELSLHCTLSLAPRGRKVFWISRSPAIIITGAPRGTHMAGIPST